MLENHRVWKETEGSKYGNSHANSYTDVLKAKVVPSFSCIKLPLKVNLEDIGHSIFHKVFVGFMENTGMPYNMQEIFNTKGYFSVHVTPFGANMCLFED